MKFIVACAGTSAVLKESRVMKGSSLKGLLTAH